MPIREIKFRFECRFWFNRWVQIKEMKFTFFFHQWNVTISRSMGMGIYVGPENWSKLSKDTRVNINLKFGTKSQGWGSGSHS